MIPKGTREWFILGVGLVVGTILTALQFGC
jgi:hypothetical protein